MSQRFSLVDVRALIIDIDGTLLRGPVPMPGLPRFFTFLRARRIAFLVVSNNATKSATEYWKRLANLGAKVNVEQILTAAAATATYLAVELSDGARLFVIGERALHDVLRQAGFVLVSDAGRPVDAVVVGGDSTLTYEKLKYAALLLQRGARFVGTNPDVLCPTEEGLVPEAGATLAALKSATGISPTVIGKPERYLFDMAVERMRSEPAETAVLGDRLETDILGGQRAGLKTVLVTSGIDNEGTILQKGIEPDLVVSGLDVLADLWEKQSSQGKDSEAEDEDP